MLAGSIIETGRRESGRLAAWPAYGRFVQTDPIGYADSPNLYQYALNDPTDLDDPMGLTTTGCDANVYVGGCAAIIVSASGPGVGGAGDAHGANNGSFSNEPGREPGNREPGIKQPQNRTCGQSSLIPHGIGISGGASADAGIPGALGAAANGSVGAGAFYSGNQGLSGGAFASGGAAAYAGSASASAVRGSRAVVAGASASVGGSLFVTNAQSAQQLSGPFTTYSLNVGFGPIQFAASLSLSGSIYQVSVSPPFAGESVGLSASRLRTTTAATPGCH